MGQQSVGMSRQVVIARRDKARLPVMSRIDSGSERASDRIRAHLQRVAALRAQSVHAGVHEAVGVVKRLQAARFRTTYRDFQSRPASAPAVAFFLDELYGEHDFSRRDEQFGRIAGALERLFPPAVSSLAVDLTEAHALTETLDHAVGLAWAHQSDATDPAERYVHAWRACGERDGRERQLAVVQHMGRELQRLTRMKPLRLGLRMMRNPARAAGLESLQHFLESGFDAFVSLGDATAFLEAIQTREASWIATLFDEPVERCADRLRQTLAGTPFG